VWVGVLLGLAFLTKTTAITLLPVVALAFMLRPHKSSDALDGQAVRGKDKSGGRGNHRLSSESGSSKASPGSSPSHVKREGLLSTAGVRYGLIAIGIGIFVALLWWIRNQSLYGDPLAIKAFNQAFTGSMQASTATDRLGGTLNYWVTGVGFGTMCSFFGVFGYWDVWLDVSTYYALAACCVVLVIASGISLRSRREQWPFHLLGGLFALLVLASFVRFNMQYFQAQGRYLLPALGPIAIGLASGLAFLARKRVEVVTVCLAVVLFALNVYVLRSLPAEFAARALPQTSASKT
jgi:hypothetical protein